MKPTRIREEPFVTIINKEWERGKRLLSILKNKPKFYWEDSRQLGKSYGRCTRGTNAIGIHRGFQQVKGSKQFRLWVRHQLAHIPRVTAKQRSHGRDFMEYNAQLGGMRHVPDKTRKLFKSII